MESINKMTFSEIALRLSEQRLSMLASNIANADTPNYKARDIDFRAALTQALGASTEDGAKPSLSPRGPLSFAPAQLYRGPVQGAVDGNTVEMDTERAAFADQVIRHQFLIQKVAEEYKEMENLLKNISG